MSKLNEIRYRGHIIQPKLSYNQGTKKWHPDGYISFNGGGRTEFYFAPESELFDSEKEAFDRSIQLGMDIINNH